MRPSILALVVLLWSAPLLAADLVIYPAPEAANDVRHDDKLEFLRTALERTRAQYGDYDLRPASVVMNKARQMLSLAQNQELTLSWGGTSIEMEKEFLPIRIPLRKGLGGYRIALIARERQADFDKVKTLDDLKPFLIGQGNGWASTDVLKKAGLNVTTTNYDSLFRMVAANRIDMFPRGLSEVFVEFEANRRAVPNLAVEQNLLLRYDSPYYFFVNKGNVQLAKRIEQGLRAMIKDGSFDEIFWRYNGESIRKSRLHERRVIYIQDHDLPPATPLKDKSLWFDPSVKPK